jgi:outer membrane protein TolC
VAETEEKKAEIDVDRVKTQISLEIDTILNRIKTDKQRLETGRKSKEVAFQTLEGEIKRLNQGVSTSFQVLQYQTQYSQTRSRELAALADLNKDQLDLWLVTGQLLEKKGIVIDATPSLRASPIVSE